VRLTEIVGHNPKAAKQLAIELEQTGCRIDNYAVEILTDWATSSAEYFSANSKCGLVQASDCQLATLDLPHQCGQERRSCRKATFWRRSAVRH
jgi:hypothetical protein